MALGPTFHQSDGRSSDRASGYGEGRRGMASQIFLWFAWAAAAAFWGLTLTTGVGILSASNPMAMGVDSGEAGAGGVGWMLINFIGGLVILGLAIAYGSYRYSTRDKRKDAMTEAATHATYDMASAAGGDDDIRRSPGARRTEERAAYRAIRPEGEPPLR